MTLTMDSQTLWDQLDALARHLQPAYERLHDYVLSQPVLGADETPWKLMGLRAKASTRARLAMPERSVRRTP